MKAYSRPDTYAAAAAKVGLSRTQVFEIINGTRKTKATTRAALLSWAKAQSTKGRGDAPAVSRALQTLAA